MIDDWDEHGKLDYDKSIDSIRHQIWLYLRYHSPIKDHIKNSGPVTQERIQSVILTVSLEGLRSYFQFKFDMKPPSFTFVVFNHKWECEMEEMDNVSKMEYDLNQLVTTAEKLQDQRVRLIRGAMGWKNA